MNTRVSIIGAVVLAATVFSPGPRAASDGINESAGATVQSQDQGRGGQNRSASQSRSRVPWWKDPAVVKEIQLTPDQAQQIDKLWQDRSKEMSGRWEEQKKQESELKRMLEERKVSPDVVALQVDRVESQRTLLERSRTVMLYRMSLVLTAEQNKAFQAIVERNRRSGGHPR